MLNIITHLFGFVYTFRLIYSNLAKLPRPQWVNLNRKLNKKEKEVSISDTPFVLNEIKSTKFKKRYSGNRYH